MSTVPKPTPLKRPAQIVMTVDIDSPPTGSLLGLSVSTSPSAWQVERDGESVRLSLTGGLESGIVLLGLSGTDARLIGEALVEHA
jgi:hypothetical protein